MSEYDGIKALLETTGMSAAEMTGTFGQIGHGNMQNGIRFFADTMHEMGLWEGRREGIVGTTVVLSVVFLLGTTLVGQVKRMKLERQRQDMIVAAAQKCALENEQKAAETTTAKEE